jgi:GrpB-like predicted nucleotidyltransferase (UPF0157 family)
MTPSLRLVPYDSAWPARFAAEADRLRLVLRTAAVAIEHVGSTAVPGLAGKQVLDIAIAVATEADADVCIGPMQTLGYHYRGPHADDPRRRYDVRDDDTAEKYRGAQRVGWNKGAYSLAKGPFVQHMLAHL